MIQVLLCGAGGYGSGYLDQLLREGEAHGARLAAVVEPYAGPELRERLAAAGVPLYAALEEGLRAGNPELTIISAPTPLHVPYAIAALEAGSHVLLEKPVSATVQDAQALIRARDAAGKLVGVGFQWSYAKAMLALKKDILAGLYGKPLALKAAVLWPRDRAYYQRGSGWAAKLKDAEGRWNLDSVSANATAHYLFNPLWLLGDRMGSAARVKALRAGLMRANPIETYDTAAFELRLEGGALLRYYAAHPVLRRRDPWFVYGFEKGTVSYAAVDAYTEADAKGVVGHLQDGRVIEYGNPYAEERRKTWVMLDAIRGQAELPCTVEAALVHTLCINASMDAAVGGGIFQAPPERVHETETGITYVEGLEELLETAFTEDRMPDVGDARWWQMGPWIQTEGYTQFPAR